MMAEDSDEGKEFAASQKKLDDARNDGNFARSPEFLSATALAATGLVILQSGGAIIERLGGLFTTLLGQVASPHESLPPEFLATVLRNILPVFLAAPIAVLMVIFATRAAAWAPKQVAPKWSRLNPVTGVTNRLGPDGLIRFVLLLLKTAAIGTVIAALARRASDRYLSMPLILPDLAPAALTDSLRPILIAAMLTILAFGTMDLGVQIVRFHMRMKMSRTEMRDEQKDSEGDPHVKGQRRQKGRELAQARSLTEVPKADVIIVNPEHYAVALKWNRKKGAAPMVVAKGVDEVAARIRQIASENGVPIHRDPPTARMIHASVPVGQEIRPEHYRAVAASIRFADAMRRKMRQRTRP